MANNIELFEQYVPLFDEKLHVGCLTGDLDGASNLAQAGANAHELVIPMVVTAGMTNYDKEKGYPTDSVNTSLQTKACNYERSFGFTIDNLDNQEMVNILFEGSVNDALDNGAVPELDAFRIATYAQKAGGSETGALTTGAAVVAALRKAITAMDNAGVPATNRYLYITSELNGLIEDMDTTKSRAVMSKFAKVTPVLPERMYSKIDLKADGEHGYAKASDGKDINFLVVYKPAVIQFQKHVTSKVVTPKENQDGDFWKFGYRTVGIAEVYENKRKGLYVHTVD